MNRKPPNRVQDILTGGFTIYIGLLKTWHENCNNFIKRIESVGTEIRK